MITAEEWVDQSGVKVNVDFDGRRYVQIDVEDDTFKLSSPIPRSRGRITANALAEAAIADGLETYRHPDGTPEVVFVLDWNEKKCWIEPYWPANSEQKKDGTVNEPEQT